MNNQEIIIKNIPLSRPDISQIEIDSVLEVLQTPNLSLGPKLNEFENKFAEYLDVKHAIAVNSGTSGLHLAVKSLNINETDAVITTPFSFIASANCILFEKAMPIFVDIEEDSLNIDADKIQQYIEQNCYWNEKSRRLFDRRTGRHVKAILPVHVFGLPCNMDAIAQIAHEYNLYIIEDACEAIGAEFDGRKVGTFGDMGVFAFYPNKQMTTGEGGMIVTNHEKLANLCRSLRNQGRDSNGGWLAHNRLGYNYRLSDLNCALGIAQLSRISEFLEKRERVASKYTQRLRNFVRVPSTMARVKRSWFTYVVCLPDHYTKSDRDRILQELKKQNIGCNNYFPPIHLQPFYVDKFGYQKGDFPITEHVSERTLALAFHNNLLDNEIEYVAQCLKDIMRQFDNIVLEESFVQSNHAQEAIAVI